MGEHQVALIAGDGIGPEIAVACVRIIKAAGASIDWIPCLGGQEALRKGEALIPVETLDQIAKCKVAYKGPLTTPIGTGHTSANVLLRKHFKLFANVRPIKTQPGIRSRYENVDLVVIRENTEDLYSGIEHQILPGVVESIKIITAEASERVARFAFEYCRKHERKHVTGVHKANIMKLSDGLFLQSIRSVHASYPDLRYDEVIVDNLCNQLVLNPERFDVLLAQNLYGDIVSDLCAGLVGGLGVAPGANFGESCAIFEAIHGTAPDIAGKGVANPSALLLSGCLMLEHLGLLAASHRIRSALNRVLTERKMVTPDLGGRSTTEQFTDAVIRAIENGRE